MYSPTALRKGCGEISLLTYREGTEKMKPDSSQRCSAIIQRGVDASLRHKKFQLEIFMC